MPPKSKHQRRNSFSEEEIANLLKAQDDKTTEELKQAEYEKYLADVELSLAHASSASNVINYDIIKSNDIIYDEEGTSSNESAAPKIRTKSGTFYISNLDPDKLYGEGFEEDDNIPTVSTRSRSTYIPINRTIDTIREDDFDDDDEYPFALNPNSGEGLKLTNTFADYDKYV